MEAPPPEPEPAPPPKPPRLPPGPKVEGTPPSALPEPPMVVTETPPPPKKPEPVKRGRRPARGSKPAAAPAAEVAPAAPVGPAPPDPAAPPSPTPRLGQILTAEQRKEYTRSLESNAERARQALASIQGKPLTSEQNEMVGRIRSFLQQADQVREQDLVTAASLAERAHSLARDLLARMR